MARSLACAALVAVLTLGSSGCLSHTHIVGNGPQSGYKASKRQMYVLWGLIPINDVDTQHMVRGAKDYAIHTQTGFIDGFVAALTYNLFSMRTVTVEKAARAYKDALDKRRTIDAASKSAGRTTRGGVVRKVELRK